MKVDKNQCCNIHSVVSDVYDKILGYVINKTNNKELALDITQDVMGRLIDAYNKNTKITNVKAWLFQVTRNAIADKYRKTDKLEFKSIEEQTPSADSEFNIMTEDFIIPMIKLLPEKYSFALYMSDIQNMKHADIAVKLNLSLSATKMRCQRARKKLHELFLECCDIHYTPKGAFASCTIKTTCTPLLQEEEKLNKKK